MTRFSWLSACATGWLGIASAQDSILDLQSGPLSGTTLSGGTSETLGANLAPTQFGGNPGLLLMAPFRGASGGGTAYWVFNGAGLTNPSADPDTFIQQAFTISAAQDRDRLDAGHQIGDFNDDGLADFVFRIRPISSPTTATAYIVFGSVPVQNVDLATLPSAQGLVITSDQAAGPAGEFTVAGSGDFDGDGVADLLLGLPEGVGDTSRSGLAFVLTGGNDLGGVVNLDALPPERLLTIRGERFESYLGNEVAFAGDVNQDGFDEVLVGSLSRDAFLIKGRASLPATPIRVAALTATEGTRLSAQNPLDSVTGAGDVNGDGRPDFALASTDPAVILLPSSRDPGAAYVVFGDSALPVSIDLESLTPDEGFKVIGFEDGDDVGTTLSGGGDVNGDGFDDLLIGAHLAEPPGPASFLIFGGPGIAGPLSLATLTASQGALLNPGAGAGLEQVPVFAGDLDSDGIDDLAVGDRLGNGATGRAYVLRGNIRPQGTVPGPGGLVALIARDETATGLTLNSIFASGFSDPVDGFGGVAFVQDQPSSLGQWQFQTEGSATWLALATGPSAVGGVLYAPDNRIRFRVADGENGVPPELTVQLWDGRGDEAFQSTVNLDEVAPPLSPFSAPLVISAPPVAAVFLDGFE